MSGLPRIRGGLCATSFHLVPKYPYIKRVAHCHAGRRKRLANHAVKSLFRSIFALLRTAWSCHSFLPSKNDPNGSLCLVGHAKPKTNNLSMSGLPRIRGGLCATSFHLVPKYPYIKRIAHCHAGRRKRLANHAVKSLFRSIFALLRTAWSCHSFLPSKNDPNGSLCLVGHAKPKTNNLSMSGLPRIRGGLCATSFHLVPKYPYIKRVAHCHAGRRKRLANHAVKSPFRSIFALLRTAWSVTHSYQTKTTRTGRYAW